ncbi:putative zinc knuckle domain protein [Erysiphe necator]|uniref:Putative zinc knuckle domain protein n=1 Tax=Uncinula necator TaxID=52586 RepID=A0A0B1NZ94_UNCNE|nr:putative zinc knuckle domain protein [Erysiphe necator]
MLNPKKHKVVALQEPSLNPRTLDTYCPRGYILCMEPTLETKVAFLISRDIGVANWTYKWYSNLVAEIKLSFHESLLRIVNVYSPTTSGSELTGWDETTEAIAHDRGSCLFLGDFNCHHPMWGGHGAQRDTRAQQLLNYTLGNGLDLITPEGIPTFRRNGARGTIQETVIDLTFATGDLLKSIHACRPREDWCIRHDHIPIEIILTTGQMLNLERRRCVYHKANLEKMKSMIRECKWEQAQQPLVALQEVIIQALNEHCPRAHPSPFAKPAWSAKATELVANARSSRRQALATKEDHDVTRAKLIRQELKKEIRRLKRSSWRSFVASSTDTRGDHNRGLWNLSKWAKKSTNIVQGPPHLPGLRRSETDPPTDDNRSKVAILSDKFFPKRVEADLSDMELIQQAKRHTIAIPDVTPDEVGRILKQLPRNKAPGPDEIPNEILQALLYDWRVDLAQAIRSLLRNGQIPSSFKESITLTIRKERHPDYTLPSSYRPIALENSLAKIVEKLVANRMIEAAEQHNMLPWAQMGARKNRSTILALELLTSTVQTAWEARPSRVVSMLGLDIKGAFDNVSKRRLLWF